MTDKQIQERAEAKYKRISGNSKVSDYIVDAHRNGYMTAFKECQELMSKEWVKTAGNLPEFSKPVIGFCQIYGRSIYTYEPIGDFAGVMYGNWHDGKSLGVLPPIYWMYVPELPII